MTIHMIPLETLTVSPENARKSYDPEKLEELKASIMAHGLLQNLVITEVAGQPVVEAGGRRLRALLELAEAGELPADYEVPCELVFEADALEISLAENTIREPMHPADEFEAFAKMVADGKQVSEIANRFGTTVRHVEQRLRLSACAPELIDEYRAGKLTLDQLRAFTVADNPDKQLEYYHNAKYDWELHPNDIRRALTKKCIKGDHGLVKFVDLDAYTAAGGTVRRDLFGEADYIENVELLERLANDKIRFEVEKLEAEGWDWVDADLEFQHIKPANYITVEADDSEVPPHLPETLAQLEAQLEEVDGPDGDEEESQRLQDQIDDIEAEIESFKTFAPEQKAQAGCYVGVLNGKICIVRGLTKPEALKKAEAKSAKTAAKEEKQKQAAKKDPANLSQSLTDELKQHRLPIMQKALIDAPHIAIDLLLFTLAEQIIGQRFYGQNCDLNARKTQWPVLTAKSDAAQAVTGAAEILSTNWLKKRTAAERFTEFRKLEPLEKQMIGVYSFVATLQAAPIDVKQQKDSALELALSLAGISVAKWWRPTKENFFSRIGKEQLMTIGAELVGTGFAESYGGKKKGELAEIIEDIIAAPDSQPTDELADKVKNWLPAGMQFLPAQAGEVKPSPATKKKAPAKQAAKPKPKNAGKAAKSPKKTPAKRKEAA